MSTQKSPEQYADEGVFLFLDEGALIGKTPQEIEEAHEWFRRYEARRQQNKQAHTLPAEAIAVISDTSGMAALGSEAIASVIANASTFKFDFNVSDEPPLHSVIFAPVGTGMSVFPLFLSLRAAAHGVPLEPGYSIEGPSQALRDLQAQIDEQTPCVHQWIWSRRDEGWLCAKCGAFGGKDRNLTPGSSQTEEGRVP